MSDSGVRFDVPPVCILWVAVRWADETSYRLLRTGDHGGREVLSVSTMTR